MSPGVCVQTGDETRGGRTCVHVDGERGDRARSDGGRLKRLCAARGVAVVLRLYRLVPEKDRPRRARHARGDRKGENRRQQDGWQQDPDPLSPGASLDPPAHRSTVTIRRKVGNTRRYRLDPSLQARKRYYDPTND